MASVTVPRDLYVPKENTWSLHSVSIRRSLVSTCASLIAAVERSSTSSVTRSILALRRSTNLNVSGDKSNTTPVILPSSTQCRSRMSGLESACSKGNISRKSSIFFRQSVYAGQSRNALGSFLHCAWNWETCSLMVSMLATTSVHRMSA